MPDWLLDLDEPAAMTVALGVVAVAVLFGVIAHEAGHALMAEALGLGPRRVEIGDGPLLLRFRIGRCWVIWRLWPFRGGVQRLPYPPARRAAVLLVTIAGALGNAVGAVFMSLPATLYPDAADLLAPLWGVQVGLGVLNLVPMPNRRTGGSDGMKIVRLLQGRAPDWFTGNYAALLQTVLPPGMPLPSPSADAPELLYQCARRDRLGEAWANRDAAATIAALLEKGGLTSAEQAAARQNLAARTGRNGRRPTPPAPP